MDNEILVSIICNTYNHEKYIRDALESFVMQKTSFPFEVLVHDDASTDCTADIIREYEKRYPEIIRPIYQTENKYSKHISINRNYQYPRARGRYIALCEGDDYWSDSLKLQKQVDAMEKHHNVDMCAHAATKILSGEKVGLMAPFQNECVISVDSVILGGGNYFATNSLLFRKTLFSNTYRFYEYLRMDFTLQILGALRGGIIYLPENMSVYRLGVQGSWTDRMRVNKNNYLAFLEKAIQMFNILDEETFGQHHRIIQRRKAELWFRRLNVSNYSCDFTIKDFYAYIHYLPKIEQAKELFRFLCHKIGVA